MCIRDSYQIGHITSLSRIEEDRYVRLDKFTVRSLELMLLLEKINELGTTVLVVTHEKELVDAFSKRVISIDAGRVISDGLDGYYGYEAE